MVLEQNFSFLFKHIYIGQNDVCKLQIHGFCMRMTLFRKKSVPKNAEATNNFSPSISHTETGHVGQVWVMPPHWWLARDVALLVHPAGEVPPARFIVRSRVATGGWNLDGRLVALPRRWWAARMPLYVPPSCCDPPHSSNSFARNLHFFLLI